MENKNEWKIITIGECSDILGDGLHGTPVYSKNSEYAFINGNNLSYGKILIKLETKKVSLKEYEKYKKPLNDRTILVSINGTLGNIAMYNNEKIILGKSACYFNVKENICKKFIYYILSSYKFKKYLELNATGTTIKNISLKQMREYSFKLPPLNIQEKIAKILSDIDEKIELNNKINDNLEKQAQLIFKSWFIENPQKYSWKQGTFSDIIGNTLGGDWGKEQSTENYIKKVACIRGADIPNIRKGDNKDLPIRYILDKNYNIKKLLPNDLVIEISGGSPTQSTGRIAHISKYSLEYCSENLICTNFCRAIRPQNNFSMFVFYYWQYLYDKGIFFSYENGTTGIKNLDLNGFITSEQIYIPTEDLLFKFDDFCQKISNVIFSNGKQNEKLTNLKNYLLPKLMNGEIDVENIEL